MTEIVVYYDDKKYYKKAKKLSEELSLLLVDKPSGETMLQVSGDGLSLSQNLKQGPKPVRVDFLSGQARHRLKYGGGKNQLIAKAVGANKNKNLSVMDVTAGLGKDAFVLATLGCHVTMIERSKIIAALLGDGLQRLSNDPSFNDIQLTLLQDDAIQVLANLTPEQYPDVIYIDPMFPKRTKSSLVKKEMRLLRDVVGEDTDADMLLAIALERAKKRVVVKRAKSSPTLHIRKPEIVYRGKSCRYDVYMV